MPLAACGFTRHRKKPQASKRVSHDFLFSSPPRRRQPAKYKKKHNRQTVLIFFHGFRISLSLFSFRSASLQISSSMGFFVFPSASGSWQKEEGWLLICRCHCVRATDGGCWVCGRCWSEEAGRRPVCAKESWWVRKGTSSVGAIVRGLQLEAG